MNVAGTELADARRTTMPEDVRIVGALAETIDPRRGAAPERPRWPTVGALREIEIRHTVRKAGSLGLGRDRRRRPDVASCDRRRSRHHDRHVRLPRCSVCATEAE